MLLNLEDIRRRLDVLAAHSEFDLQDLRLRGPGLRSSDFDRIEEVLRCKLPASYREIASAVNFGYFTLGSVQFGSGRYSQADALIAHNSPPYGGAMVSDLPTSSALAAVTPTLFCSGSATGPFWHSIATSAGRQRVLLRRTSRSSSEDSPRRTFCAKRNRRLLLPKR